MDSILTWIAQNQQIIYIVILMIFVGIEVIGHVPSVLHTPLMSGANAIHGVVIIGAIIVMGKAEADNFLALVLGFLAVILGTILGILISMPRMLLAISEQGQLPAVLARVHERWRTPWIAILVSSGLSFGFAIFSDLIGALTFATATRLVAYILCCVALFRMTRRVDAPQPQFRLPAAGPIALATAILFSGVLALGATKEVPPLLTVLAIGLGLFGLTRWMARRRAS